MTVKPIIVGELRTGRGRLEEGREECEIFERIESSKIFALLGSARIQRRELETWRYLLSPMKGPPANAGVKTSSKE